MQQYNKLIVAAIGIAVMVLKDQIGLDLTSVEPALIDAVLGLLTAVAVWRVPNKPAEADPMQEIQNEK